MVHSHSWLPRKVKGRDRGDPSNRSGHGIWYFTSTPYLSMDRGECDYKSGFSGRMSAKSLRRRILKPTMGAE